MFETVKCVMLGIVYITGLIHLIMLAIRKRGNNRIIKIIFFNDMIFSLSVVVLITLDVISSQAPSVIICCVFCLALIAMLILINMISLRKCVSKNQK